MSIDTSTVSELIVNFLPSLWSRDTVCGLSLPYIDKDQFERFRHEYQGEFLLRRRGKTVQAIPLVANHKTIDGESRTFAAQEDWSLFQRLLEEGIRRFLHARYPTVKVSEFGPVVVERNSPGEDIIRNAAAFNSKVSEQLDFLHIYRTYRIRASYMRRNAQDERSYGVLIDMGTTWHISASIMDLVSSGIDVAGCYAVPLQQSISGEERGFRIAGQVRAVNGVYARLSDARDKDIIDARQYTIEASLENVVRCINSLLGRHAADVIRRVRSEVANTLGAEGHLQRIEKIAATLSEEPIHCAVDLEASIAKQLIRTGNETPCSAIMLEPPRYVFRYGRPPVAGPIAGALAARGPFDQDTFQKTTPHILYVTPNRFMGRVDQFLRTWRDGGLRPPFANGFVAQYRLRGCDFYPVTFQETPQGPGEDYRNACLRALKESRDMMRRYDLAFVVVQEQHRLLGNNDPYLVAKAVLMGQEVPVQEIRIETIDLPVDNQPFILNNLALACYAKMGGTPWHLASSRGQGITHELVIGVGSAIVREGRLQEENRFVGITTLFNYDGVYLLSNTSHESAYGEYSETLQSTLFESLKHVSIGQGWQRGDRVRLIFHTFKPLKNLEIETVKRLVKDNLPEYVVEFAFLEIGSGHSWMIYDPTSIGYTDRRGKVRGRQVPRRGIAVLLDEQRALLAVTGPSELKLIEQGCPAPLQIKLNGASTFHDLHYLTRQVFEFTYMSWKTYNLLSMPVTITYSEAVAKLLGRLRGVRNWNSDVLQTTRLKSSLWFL